MGAATVETARTTTTGPVLAEWLGGWRRRGASSLLVAGVVALAPVAAAALLSWLLSNRVGGAGPWPSVVAVWLVLSVSAVALAEVVERGARRFLPLRVLLRLSLAFPDAAPSRFKLALRSGNRRRLEAQIARSREVDLGGDVSEAAARLLELVAGLGSHDRITRGHSERVRAYTELIAEELGLGTDDVQRLRWAGLLHDIGKLRTPAEILNKTSALTDEEWEVIRRHPLDGLALAAPLAPILGDHMLAVSDHHERWEGGGYPSGVAGVEIARAGRIVAVADAYDVMTSSRSYKAPMSARDALAELVACSGTQFDPEVVRAFLEISVRRLRLVAGPLAAFAPLVLVRRRFELIVGRLPITGAGIGAAAVATAFTLGVAVGPGGVAGPRSHGGQGRVGVAAAASAGSGTRGVGGAHQPGSAAAGLAGGAGAASGPVVARDQADATTDQVGDHQSGDDPSGDQPLGDPATGGRVDIVIEPSHGIVELDGVPPGADGPTRVVGLDAAGVVACDGLHVCDPIVVPTPIWLP